MVRKINILILILLVSVNSFSQERIGYFDNLLKENSSNIKDVIPIVNAENNDILMFVADAKNVYAYKLNDQFKVIDKLASDKKRRKYKTLIGNSISNENNYTVYLANKYKTTFLAVNFSFDEKKTTAKEFKLKHYDERLVQTVSVNNKFYIISTIKYKDYLFIYSFDKEGNHTRNRVNLKDVPLKLRSGKPALISQLLRNNGDKVAKIEENLPNSIEVVGDRTKMYVRDNSAVFTFDQHNEFSQVLTIKLTDFKATLNTFKKAMDDVKKNRKNSNSYINGENIYIVTSNKEKLVLDIINFKSKEILKTHTILKEEPIAFKNSPIIQEGGMYKNYRELEKTKKFLRKINADKIGVSVRYINNEYLITLGGYSPKPQGGGMMGGFGGFGFPVAAFGNVSFFFNPALFAYNASTNTKSTRIECVFDANFNHKEGEIKENVFDKIQDATTTGSSISGETVFQYKDYFILGSYYSKRKQYTFTKFTD